jgi:hypothetical protein
MTKIEAEVPEAIYKQAVELAKKENVPVERLVSLALAQALGAWGAEKPATSVSPFEEYSLTPHQVEKSYHKTMAEIDLERKQGKLKPWKKA